MEKITDKQTIIKYILFAIIILESFFIVYYAAKTIEKNHRLEEKIQMIEKENISLKYENNHLINENERLGMVNSEVWELFLADYYVKEGKPYNE